MEGADPEFPVPDWVECKYRASHGTLPQFVLEPEFQWMESCRPLEISADSLQRDYGEAEEIMAAFASAGCSHLLGTLNWPGVGTRWRSFLEWSVHAVAANDPAVADCSSALRGFGNYLGRVVTYRALALDDAALAKILEADCIFPSGQLHASAEELATVVETKGVRQVAVARLFIAHLKRLLGMDPSISLHDDWQTTSLIATGYARGGRRIHLFEVSCPKVESLGWTLQQVAEHSGDILPGYDKHDPWFCFPAPGSPQGVWFDGKLQRTERYGLYGVPFLSQRLLRRHVFASPEEVGRAMRPFAQRQAELHQEHQKTCN